MTRYTMSARKDNAETQYTHTHTHTHTHIYIYSKKITSALKWGQKKINVFACAWSEFFAIASWYVFKLM